MDEMSTRESINAQNERIAALERKLNEIDAVVKGITDELLDLKSIAMRMNRIIENQRPARSVRMQGPTSTVVVQSREGQRSEIAGSHEASKRGESDTTEMILQMSGELKPEKRKPDDNIIIASAGFAKGREAAKENQGSKKKPDTIIVAEEKETTDKK